MYLVLKAQQREYVVSQILEHEQTTEEPCDVRQSLRFTETKYRWHGQIAI